ncbi:MAG TPA: hypothetical protein VFC42_05790 [Methylomirabilota bacterium]|jgi:hypothetical protein|nr:hypothetical protein [Methylomirabilota bacterium]
MRSRLASRPMLVGLGAAVVALAGCGGGGKGGTAPDPNAPVISDLVGEFLSGTCPGPGTPRRLTFRFQDADGNVSGGTVSVVATFDGGATFPVDFPIPSPALRITGTTSGTITLSACVTYGSRTSLTEAVTLTDASGRKSNTLTTTTPRPAGAPELPQPAPAPLWSPLG